MDCVVMMTNRWRGYDKVASEEAPLSFIHLSKPFPPGAALPVLLSIQGVGIIDVGFI